MKRWLLGVAILGFVCVIVIGLFAVQRPSSWHGVQQEGNAQAEILLAGPDGGSS